MGKLFLFAVSFLAVMSALSAAQPKITDEKEAKVYSQALYKLFCAGDYNAYAAQLPESLLKHITPEIYKQSCSVLAQKLGTLKDMTYVSTLRQPGNLTILVWKCEYEAKTGGRFDCLVTTAFTVNDGKWTLAGFYFL
jgi:hypothetical protein